MDHIALADDYKKIAGKKNGTSYPAALECLALVFEEGSFERAARRQMLSQSAVSQRVSTLESRVGHQLVIRAKPIALTMAGSLLLKHAKKLRLLRADLSSELRKILPSRSNYPDDGDRISVAVDAESLAMWAAPALGKVIHSDHLLEVLTCDLRQNFECLVDGRVQGCISSVAEPPPGCKGVFLGAYDYVCVAQPEFAAMRCSSGLGPNNFRDLPFIAINRRDDTQMLLAAKALGLPQVALKQIYMPSTESRLEAVLAGWGVSFMPRICAGLHLERGDLVEITSNHTLQVPIFWHCWAIESPILVSLTEAFCEAASDVSWASLFEHPDRGCS